MREEYENFNSDNRISHTAQILLEQTKYLRELNWLRSKNKFNYISVGKILGQKKNWRKIKFVLKYCEIYRTNEKWCFQRVLETNQIYAGSPEKLPTVHLDVRILQKCIWWTNQVYVEGRNILDEVDIFRQFALHFLASFHISRNIFQKRRGSGQWLMTNE